MSTEMYEPETDEPFELWVTGLDDITMGASEMSFKFTNEGIILDVFEDEQEMFTESITYQELLEVIQDRDIQRLIVSERAKARAESMAKHPTSYSKPSGGGKPLLMRVFNEIPEYEDWCKANHLDSANEDNYNNYCEWKANS